eukprot:GILI01022030.1.p1 GENE.GILI01022030.1~~GILI01022030.1.p1  ORF type:complete len:459 (+),score=66.74 GILI01022030.1:73-1449(+)
MPGVKRERESDEGESASQWQLLSNLKSVSDAILKRIVSPNDQIEMIPTKATVSEMLPLINTAGQLLLGSRIEVTSAEGKSTSFDLVEVEAYVIGPNHNDTFTHTDPQQGVFGTYYFHRMGPGKSYKGGSFKGMDITIGNSLVQPASVGKHASSGSKWSHPAPFYGGYLVRSLRNTSTGDVIEGPSLVVDTLLAATQKSSILALVEESGRRYLTCDGKDSWLDGASAADAKKASIATMKLITNPLTAPTVSTVVNIGADAVADLDKQKGISASIPPHILLAPRVGLIPRTIHDLRYGGAFYRYINSQPGDLEGGKVSAKGKGSAVQLAKVRSGIVAALFVQQIMKGATAEDMLKAPYLESLRTATGSTNAAIKSVQDIVTWLVKSDSKSASVTEVARCIVKGDASADEVASPAAPSVEEKSAKAFLKTVLGEDVKKAEIISRVTAFYGAYLKDGLGIKY